MKKGVICLILAILVILGLVLYSQRPEPVTVPDPVHPDRIIHGGGEIDRLRCTNSQEALYKAYTAGMEYIEVDLSLTSDGKVVCLHDWNHGILYGYREEEFPLSYKEFDSARLYGYLNSMTLDDLALYLEECEGVYLITDTKENNLEILQEIAHAYPEILPRLLPQIYSEEELEPVREMGYDNIIYTLYAMDNQDKFNGGAIAAFARDNDLWGIALPWELTQYSNYLNTLLESGVPLYTHTLNWPREIKAQWALGITGVYSDWFPAK